MSQGENPFVVQGYKGPSDFCDRATESKTAIEALTNGRNITLFSLRRMGKTGLLFHIGHQLEAKKKARFLYTDIFNTYNNEDLAKKMGDVLMQSFAPKRGIVRWFSNVFKSAVPMLSFDPLTGNPELSFDFRSPQETAKTIENIFQYLRGLKVNIVWAMDEFQQIANYTKPGTEALLRGLMQQTPNVHFIFSGSHKTMLTNMFAQGKKPFYQSTQWMEIHEISRKNYTAFIDKKFNAKSQRIGKDEIAEVLDYTCCHTWYTQFFCNRLYASGRKINADRINEEKLEITREFEPVYHNFKALLSAFQWQVLRAVAIEERVYSPNSFEFLVKHKLGAAASVKRALESLVNQDMVSIIQEDAKRYFRLNDVFLMRWFQMQR